LLKIKKRRGGGSPLQQRENLSILEDASLSAKSVSESTFDSNMVSADLQAFIKGSREPEQQGTYA